MFEVLALAASPQPTAAAAAIYGLDNETVRSIVQGAVTIIVALIGGGVGYLIALENGRNLELEKRAYSAMGLRRKLTLLMDRAGNSLTMRIQAMDKGLSKRPRIVTELREYILTPELAAAIQDDSEMSAAYDVLEAIELAYSLALSYLRSSQRVYDEAVSAGEIEAEHTPMWTSNEYARFIGFFVPPCLKIEAYWKLKGDSGRQKRMADAIEDAKAKIAMFTGTKP